MFGAWVLPCRLEPILLQERGVGDDDFVLRTELVPFSFRQLPGT